MKKNICISKEEVQLKVNAETQTLLTMLKTNNQSSQTDYDASNSVSITKEIYPGELYKMMTSYYIDIPEDEENNSNNDNENNSIKSSEFDFSFLTNAHLDCEDDGISSTDTKPTVDTETKSYYQANNSDEYYYC